MKTYGYDDLDRLTSADMSVNSVSTYQRDFTYDQYGCIQQVTDNGTTISSYGYSLTPFHAPVSYNNESLDYDANGNLVEDEDFIYTYNDANQLSEVRYSDNSSLVEKYWYDANGQRVKKQNSVGEFNYYVNQFYEIDNGTATSYFFRDDERIAKQTDEGMEWYLSDHLGSTTLLINESGLEVERTEYYPYGQVQSGGLEKYGFTGQENDADTELMYYGARYYSPEYRIFVQPDTMLPDPYNPQALNRYSYTLNNPVKYTDPSGHYVESAIDIAFIAMDLNDIRTGNADKWTYIGLATDVVCLALPGATGGRLAVKAVEEGVTHADNVGDLFHLMDKTLDAEKKLDNVIDTSRSAENIANPTILNKWANTNWENAEDAFEYHYETHVTSRNIDMSREQYTHNAENLFEQYGLNNLPENAKVKETTLKDGSIGVKITIGPKSNNEMGIYTKDGQIVSYHPKNPNK
ncbi:RHS repeat-associated core domain [Methanolobus tindarius DSM 2278]|uniref:RHS repeat-associated core domain n=1 Tax=Methanolobus tindarius DSM 2278 TaxID=1090322 RepID=W9DT86_METTI|nr:RHS repeat-associated core domain [Methanolobus tindarius DSM 2278]